MAAPPSQQFEDSHLGVHVSVSSQFFGSRFHIPGKSKPDLASSKLKAKKHHQKVSNISFVLPAVTNQNKWVSIARLNFGTT